MDFSYRIGLVNDDENIKETSIMSTDNNFPPLQTLIKVIGVGNGGCNAVNRMIEDGLQGVDFIAMNTDSQALSRSKAETKLILGERITGGLGAGTDPEKGAEAAREDMARIEELVANTDLVFIVSSFGGGTGTGASPVIAEISKRSGALTIGVITKPFEMEGTLRMKRAESGIDKIMPVIDSLIIIPNENLYSMLDSDSTSFEDALSIVDDVLRQGVQGVSDIITQSGEGINVDFADVKTMISLSNGRAHLGIGIGKGEERLRKATVHAFNNPLLDVASIKNANGILANIICPTDFSLREYKEATSIVSSYAREDANIKIGVCKKEDIKDEIRITIVATGFDCDDKEKVVSNDIANQITKKEVEDNIEQIKLALIKEQEEKLQKKLEAENAIKEALELERITKEENIREEELKRLEEQEKTPFVQTRNVTEHLKVETQNNIVESNFHNSRKDDLPLEPSHDENREVLVALNEAKGLRNEDQAHENNQPSNNDFEKEEESKPPFDIVANDEMRMHQIRGNKPSLGDSISSDELDVPAFLRRSIETRKGR